MEDIKWAKTCIQFAIHSVRHNPGGAIHWLQKADEILKETIETEPHVIIIEEAGHIKIPLERGGPQMEFKQYNQDMISIMEDLQEASDRLKSGNKKLHALADLLDDVINKNTVVIRIDGGLDDDIKPAT